MTQTQKEATPGNADELKAWGELLQQLKKSEEEIQSEIDQAKEAKEGKKPSIPAKPDENTNNAPPKGSGPKGPGTPGAAPGPDSPKRARPRPELSAEDAAMLEALRKLADK